MTKTEIAETRDIAEIDARIEEIVAEAEKVSHDQEVIYPAETGPELDELIERRIELLIPLAEAAARRVAGLRCAADLDTMIGASR